MVGEIEAALGKDPQLRLDQLALSLHGRCFEEVPIAVLGRER